MALFEVLTLGAATQDVFLRSSKFEEEPNTQAPDGFSVCIALGAKIGLDDIVYATGGGATNAAVTFAHFHLKTACIARVGQDEAGGTVKFALKRAGVDVSAFQTDREQKTGQSIILLAGSGHRAILTYRGASLQLNGTEFPWMKRGKPTHRPMAKWLYLTSLAGNEALLAQVFAYAQETKMSVAWNPGGGELALGQDVLAPYLRQTEILIVNREEAAELVQVAPRHMEQSLSRLTSLVDGTVVITDGEHGAYVHADGMTWYAPALPAQRINTTGAGDAFGSAFTAAIIKGHPVKEALQAGMLNATNVIRHMGAKAGILPHFPSKDALRDVKVELVSMKKEKRGPFGPQ